jgi:hypothetical protein
MVRLIAINQDVDYHSFVERRLPQSAHAGMVEPAIAGRNAAHALQTVLACVLR